ncbi:hypothetical protein JOF34_001209 [Microbacterium amylolyticum]|uniref:Tyrosine specific protein phosphatases domain-containing protein n=2 Tax=Microbacterium amylolyticum TaxID=936337 RepID=A0ABS4ZHU1_9MICO|nr:hypothetical protein [Microbacterium amylolyticum]
MAWRSSEVRICARSHEPIDPTLFLVLVGSVTGVVVGVVAWLLIPELTLAGALLLGAIVGPPDAVSAAAIGRTLGLPRRVMNVLSGESLINDATVTGTFGLLMPFGAYAIAEHTGGSGVLAVVAMGFYVGYHQPRTPYAQRQQEKPLWHSVDFLLESFVFAYVGLQLPRVLSTVLENQGAGILIAACRAGTLSEEVMRELFVAMDAEELAIDTRSALREEEERGRGPPGWSPPLSPAGLCPCGLDFCLIGGGVELLVVILVLEREALAGCVVEVFVEDALALGDDGGDQGLTGDVEGRAAHVEDRVDGQQQADAFQGEADGRQGQREHHGGAGGSGRCGRTDHRDENDQRVLDDRQFDAEELGNEDRGDRGVDRGAAVHLGGGTGRNGEGSVFAGHNRRRWGVEHAERACADGAQKGETARNINVFPIMAMCNVSRGFDRRARPHGMPFDSDQRLHEIRGAYNLRDTGGYQAGGGATQWGRLFRSDALHNIGDDGRQKLTELGVRHIVDLRSSIERRMSPNALDGLNVQTHHVSVFDDAAPEKQISRGVALAPMYEYIVEERGQQLASAIRVIAHDDDPVLVHCTAGKDRTGLVVAFALTVAGVDRDAVVADYAATEANLAGEWVEGTFERMTGRGIELTPGLMEIVSLSPAPVLENVLSRIDRDHGGVRAYLRAQGMTPRELDRLAEYLTS